MLRIKIAVLLFMVTLSHLDKPAIAKCKFVTSFTLHKNTMKFVMRLDLLYFTMGGYHH